MISMCSRNWYFRMAPYCVHNFLVNQVETACLLIQQGMGKGMLRVLRQPNGLLVPIVYLIILFSTQPLEDLEYESAYRSTGYFQLPGCGLVQGGKDKRDT